MFSFCCTVFVALLLHQIDGLRDPRQQPNIVMLFVDDLGYGDLGFTGHPTTHTPNIDRIASQGKILSNWYSGAPLCSASRAALMTGRQTPRTGVPPVLGPTERRGLPLNETTLAEHLRRANYTSGVVGKWHLGQRTMYLPHNRGFDEYLGIPFSDDMGTARRTPCPQAAPEAVQGTGVRAGPGTAALASGAEEQQREGEQGDRGEGDAGGGGPQGVQGAEGPETRARPAKFDAQAVAAGGARARDLVGVELDFTPPLPLVHQRDNTTSVTEQPLDFTHLGRQYNDFALRFIAEHRDRPFFLYVPFSHVHTTLGGGQYAGCAFQGSTARGPFGDALAEVDWMVGNIVQALKEQGIEENTLVLFTSDNGPWLAKGLNGGSMGLLTGSSAGYLNTGVWSRAPPRGTSGLRSWA